MIDLKDSTYTPAIDEICDFTGNPLLGIFLEEMERVYKPVCKIEFSKCSMEYGWNVKLKKAGRALCTIYPREQYFTVMVVVGKREKEQVERLLPEMSAAIREVYHRTQEGNGQRWLMIDLEDEDDTYRDVLRLIEVRR